jgi:hypothetical protein
MKSNTTLPTKGNDFLEVIVYSLPDLLGVSGRFKAQKWDTDYFVEELMNWLPEFAMRWSEFQEFLGIEERDVFLSKLMEAATFVYTSDKYQKRGEFGELLLHAVLRSKFDTIPAISKIFFKDSTNDPVKGFDSVHVVTSDNNKLELWLGEVKFYNNIKRAINDVLIELDKHTKINYLKAEFIAIKRKIDPASPHAKNLKQMLDDWSDVKDLSSIFSAVTVPVLLTYDSRIVNKYATWGCDFVNCPSVECTVKTQRNCFKDEMERDINSHFTDFSKLLPAKLKKMKVKIVLILFPLDKKSEIILLLDRRLKEWQSLKAI